MNSWKDEKIRKKMTWRMECLERLIPSFSLNGMFVCRKFGSPFVRVKKIKPFHFGLKHLFGKRYVNDRKILQNKMKNYLIPSRRQWWLEEFRRGEKTGYPQGPIRLYLQSYNEGLRNCKLCLGEKYHLIFQIQVIC